jgi:hypothetical protein
VSRRTALLLSLLLAAAGLGTWNLISLRRVEAVVPQAAAPPPAPVPAPEPVTTAAVSLEKFPAPVADASGVLGHWGNNLEQMAQSWRDDLGVDVQMVTLAAPELPAETLAPEVFALRKVGEGAPTGGVLVLLNPARQEARIEVSYTLEPALPDALVGRIAEGQLAPYAAYQLAGMAVQDVVAYLKDILLQQAIEGRLALDDRFRERPAYLERVRFLSGGGGAQVRVPPADELATRDFMARVEAPRRARYAPSRDPMASAEAFLRVQQDLVGDPTLELLTEGSQCMRRRYPFAPYEEIERARRLEAGKPWRVTVSGDRAVVDSNAPPRGFAPILLQRVDGLWRVDSVETWKNLFFDRNGDYRVHNSDNPYRFALAAYGSGAPLGAEAWDLGGASIEQTLTALAAQRGALAQYLQGEVLFRNCFLPLHALSHYEKASNDAGGAFLFHETLGRRAEYLGFFDLAAEAYSRMNDYGALDQARALSQAGDAAEAVKAARRAVRRNPSDPEALGALRAYLKDAKDEAGAAGVAQQLAALAGDPLRHRPVEVRIDPPDPVLVLSETTKVGDHTVYDHTWFKATLENTSSRPVTLERVIAWTKASHDQSGLGDIKHYWNDPTGEYRHEPGERIELSRVWGYSVDTKNEQIRYVFDVCYHGEGEPRQCHASSVDVFPR